jgi:hypothetical protein
VTTPCPTCGAPKRKFSKLCLDCRRVADKVRDAARKRALNPASGTGCMWCRWSKQGPCSRHGGPPRNVKKELNRRATYRRKGVPA